MRRWHLALGALALVLAAWFLLGLGRYLGFEAVLAQRAQLAAWTQANPLLASAAFFAGCMTTVLLGLPVLPLAFGAGAVFGILQGLALVSFASATGVTLAFLLARWFMGEAVARRLGGRLVWVRDGLARNGAFFLFMLRMTPVFPLLAVNLLLALTSMRARTFYLVSQAGMLTPLLVFVNAGSRLAQVRHAADLLSPAMILSLAALGALPLGTRLLARRLLRPTSPGHGRGGLS